jgi:hypothetical protein
MIFYAQTGLCRWRVLLEYFGDGTTSMERCSTCDNCLRAAEHASSDSASVTAQAATSRRTMRPLGPGDAVGVPRYGTGRVKVAVGDEITVEFPDGGVRTFLRGYVRRRRPSALNMPQANGTSGARPLDIPDDAVALEAVTPLTKEPPLGATTPAGDD